MTKFIAGLMLGIVGTCIVVMLNRSVRDARSPGPTSIREAIYGGERSVQLFRLVQNDAEYIEVAWGPRKDGLASGPACAVFDLDHKLVDWTRDSGDDSEFVDRWHRASVRTPIDLPLPE